MSDQNSSNVFSIFSKQKAQDQKGVKSPSQDSNSKRQVNTRVLKAGSVNADLSTPVQVGEYIPTQMMGKRVTRPGNLPPVTRPSLALDSLKANFNALNDLQARLRFMLKELEDLVKE
jgi:hypothetical protein